MWLSDIDICDYIQSLLCSQIIVGVNALGVRICVNTSYIRYDAVNKNLKPWNSPKPNSALTSTSNT
jgi:hypothetical protein